MTLFILAAERERERELGRERLHFCCLIFNIFFLLIRRAVMTKRKTVLVTLKVWVAKEESMNQIITNIE